MASLARDPGAPTLLCIEVSTLRFEAWRTPNPPPHYALMSGYRSGPDGDRNGILAFRGAVNATTRGTPTPIICVAGIRSSRPGSTAPNGISMRDA